MIKVVDNLLKMNYIDKCRRKQTVKRNKMDSLEERRSRVDMSWYRETLEEIENLSGLDRYSNYWEATGNYDHCVEMYQIVMTSNFNLNDGSWWNINARTPNEAINVLISDGKFEG